MLGGPFIYGSADRMGEIPVDLAIQAAAALFGG